MFYYRLAGKTTRHNSASPLSIVSFFHQRDSIHEHDSFVKHNIRPGMLTMSRVCNYNHRDSRSFINRNDHMVCNLDSLRFPARTEIMCDFSSVSFGGTSVFDARKRLKASHRFFFKYLRTNFEKNLTILLKFPSKFQEHFFPCTTVGLWKLSSPLGCWPTSSSITFHQSNPRRFVSLWRLLWCGQIGLMFPCWAFFVAQ